LAWVWRAGSCHSNARSATRLRRIAALSCLQVGSRVSNVKRHGSNHRQSRGARLDVATVAARSGAIFEVEVIRSAEPCPVPTPGSGNPTPARTVITRAVVAIIRTRRHGSADNSAGREAADHGAGPPAPSATAPSPPNFINLWRGRGLFRRWRRKRESRSRGQWQRKHRSADHDRDDRFRQRSHWQFLHSASAPRRTLSKHIPHEWRVKRLRRSYGDMRAKRRREARHATSGRDCPSRYAQYLRMTLQDRRFQTSAKIHKFDAISTKYRLRSPVRISSTPYLRRIPNAAITHN
jgi:hypothetical protein